VPHNEDEIYVITAGQALLRAGGHSTRVGPGSVIYVAAGETHRFTEITEDLAAVVLFAPAEGSRSRACSWSPLQAPGHGAASRPGGHVILSRNLSTATGR